jgi:hypothetical protein
MRPLWFGAVAIHVVTLLAAGCAQPTGPTPGPSLASPAKSPTPDGTAVNPTNIRRIGHELPPGYEVTSGIPSAASPRVIWGLGADATSKPQPCAILADPGNGRDQSAQGVSGSGSGGIVDAVVVALPGLPGPVALDQGVVAACAQWTMVAGRATAGVRLTDAPKIDGVETLGMVTDIRTTVESGTEIDSRAYTFIAYLGDYYAFTTLTVDPGSALPALSPQFAADLLVKTVSTLRG